MSFRVVDNETGDILFDTMRIDKLVEYLETMESDEDRPMKALVVSEAEETWV